MNDCPIIFDMDGVLIDSEKQVFMLLQKVLKLNEIELLDEAISVKIGMKLRPFLDYYFDKQIQENKKELILNEIYHELNINFLKYFSPTPFLIRFIKKYHTKLPFAIASMSGLGKIKKILQYLQIDQCFQIVCSSDDVKNLKPDPEIYLLVAKELGINPSRCRVIEDSIVGVEAASRAGNQIYVFKNAFNDEKMFQKYKVSGFITSKKDLTTYLL